MIPSERTQVAAGHDLFVSYAHADDEPPGGAARGWVTTLADELSKVLRRKLGGRGATIWMDHQLAANASVAEALREIVGAARTMLLVMSPGYQRSAWCRQELGGFLSGEPGHSGRDNVFLIEIEPVDRDAWPPPLQALKGIRFWQKDFEDPVPRLLGFPTPKLDEDNPYWRKVNELAHLVAECLSREGPGPVAATPQIVLAETTDDLLDSRDAVAAFLRQRGYETLPESDLPRGSEAAYVGALEGALSRVRVFAQLLGPHEGRRPAGSESSFVALQAAQATRVHDRGALEILQWRAPEVEPDRIANPAYRELVSGPFVQAGGLEEFKQQILQVLSRPPAARDPAPPAAPADSGLHVYVNADRADRTIASRIGEALGALGVTAVLSPDPSPEQTPEEIRRAQQEQLESCDGVLIVRDAAPATWIQSQLAFARRLVAPRRRGVWCALLDAAATPTQAVPPNSPSLVTLDPQRPLETGLARFVEGLMAGGGRG